MMPAAPRKVVRISTLTFVAALAVMQRGPFTAAAIADATGLHIDTAYRLITAMLLKSVAQESGRAPDALGRMSIRVFSLGSPAAKDAP